MPISYQVEGVKSPSIKKREITKWINEISHTYSRKVGDISYVFCNDEKILEINNQYLNHNYYTDIITFDYSEDDTISGDIIISLDTVKSNSELFKTSYPEELHRVIIHGILHLCGISDESPEEETKMRLCEDRALEILKK